MLTRKCSAIDVDDEDDISTFDELGVCSKVVVHCSFDVRYYFAPEFRKFFFLYDSTKESTSLPEPKFSGAASSSKWGGEKGSGEEKQLLVLLFLYSSTVRYVPVGTVSTSTSLCRDALACVSAHLLAGWSEFIIRCHTSLLHHEALTSARLGANGRRSDPRYASRRGG